MRVTIHSDYDRLIKQKKLLAKLYSTISLLKIPSDYEGELFRYGDTVRIYGSGDTFTPTSKIDLVLMTNDDDVIKKVYNEIDWENVIFFCATIVDNVLIWGAK